MLKSWQELYGGHMPTKKHIRPDEKLPLKLAAAERKLVLEGLTCLDQEIEQIVRETPSGEPVEMTLDDLDDFGGYVAAEANHCKDKSKAKKLDAVFEKIQCLLDKFTDEEPPKTVKIEDARKEKLISDQAAQIAQFATQALVAAEQLGIKKKALDKFWLAPAQREVLSLVPGVTKAVKKKLATEKATFSIAEVAGMTLALAEDLPDGDARKQVAVMYLAKHLMDHLQSGITATATPKLTKKRKGKSEVATDSVFQFKLTLLDSNPPIWRRIQVQDCTLDKLHEYIQTAMGWTNSHLHQFEIKGQRYGDLELLDDGFEDFDCEDSTTTMVSDILPKTGKRFAFKYEYDFGDSWEHEVMFEGSPPVDPEGKYPQCLEGERACPPEDCGGVWGYVEFLEAIRNPKHEEHESMMEWIGGRFDPEDFDPAKATQEMKEGLPDWRTTDGDF
jgi:hypothetical protein